MYSYVKNTSVSVVIKSGSEPKQFPVQLVFHFLKLNAQTLLEWHEDKNSGLPQSVTLYSCSKFVSELKSPSRGLRQRSTHSWIQEVCQITSHQNR